MTRSEIIAGLYSAARRSDDLAAALEASAQLHRPEFDLCAHVPPQRATAALQERAVELYPHVIENEREAARFRKESELFREAATLLINVESGIGVTLEMMNAGLRELAMVGDAVMSASELTGFNLGDIYIAMRKLEHAE